jgi:hypothetical protein
MDQLLDLGLTHFPTLDEARKVVERYVPSKLALLHSSILSAVVGGAEYGVFTALLLLLWIFAAAAFSAGTTMLKQWPAVDGKPVAALDFVASVRAGDADARFLAVRGAVSGSAFLGFAYLMREPFVLLGLYWPMPALLLFGVAVSMAAKLGYTDRLRAAADADAAARALSSKPTESQ